MKWKIRRIEYWFNTGSSSRIFVQITFWYNPVLRSTKETRITYTVSDGEDLPEWIQVIQDNI